MDPNIAPAEILWRIICTVVAGTVIGLNREAHGRAAGLRTTVLICLAASFSMLLANALLATKGKTPESFVSLDVMRLPLGILSGMGFIGAGAIIRRDNMVLGITTAATLWFSTVMGLCFGSGQIGLRFAALGLGFGAVAGLKWTEQFCKQDRSAILTLGIGPATPSEQRRRCFVFMLTEWSRRVINSNQPHCVWAALPCRSGRPRWSDEVFGEPPKTAREPHAVPSRTGM